MSHWVAQAYFVETVTVRGTGAPAAPDQGCLERDLRGSTALELVKNAGFLAP